MVSLPTTRHAFHREIKCTKTEAKKFDHDPVAPKRMLNNAKVTALDWKSVNWASVADWVSGIGSFSAAIVALHVAQLSLRIEFDGYCGAETLVAIYSAV